MGPRPSTHSAPAPANGVLGKRPRVEYDTPDLPSHADRKQWLDSQLAAFDAVVAADDTEASRSGGAAEGPAAPAAPAEGGREGAPPAEAGAAQAQQQPAAGEAGKDEGNDGGADRAKRRRCAAQHAAIFCLVYGLLEEGDDRRWGPLCSTLLCSACAPPWVSRVTLRCRRPGNRAGHHPPRPAAFGAASLPQPWGVLLQGPAALSGRPTLPAAALALGTAPSQAPFPTVAPPPPPPSAHNAGPSTRPTCPG